MALPFGTPLFLLSEFPNFRRIMLHMYAMIAGLWIILKMCMYEVSYIHIYYIIKYLLLYQTEYVCTYICTSMYGGSYILIIKLVSFLNGQQGGFAGEN